MTSDFKATTARIKDVQIIKEFESDSIVYGVYSVVFNGEKEVFIRNGNSIGVVMSYWGKLASQCVSEIRDDVRDEFLSSLRSSRH